jgi:hypothetical protein
MKVIGGKIWKKFRKICGLIEKIGQYYFKFSKSSVNKKF